MMLTNLILGYLLYETVHIATPIPDFPPRFRMDITSASTTLLTNPTHVKTTGHGTLFVDLPNKRFASFILEGDNPGDLTYVRELYVNGTWYRLDMATGKCHKTRIKHEAMLPLDEFEYQGREWLFREEEYFRTMRWRMDREWTSPFGHVKVDLVYHHKEGVIEIDREKCFAPFPRASDTRGATFGTKSEEYPPPVLLEGEPFRLQVEMDMLGESHLVLMEFECLVPQDRNDVDEKYVFGIPSICNDP